MGLMSDLKEFGQNFVLAAGAGIAKNIEERAKEDRAAILASTKELKARIAKNKAAQTKIDREVEGQLRTLNSLAPGLPVEVKKTALQSKELFDIYVDAIKNDKDKSGYWISDFAREKGFKHVTMSRVFAHPKFFILMINKSYYRIIFFVMILIHPHKEIPS